MSLRGVLFLSFLMAVVLTTLAGCRKEERRPGDVGPSSVPAAVPVVAAQVAEGSTGNVDPCVIAYQQTAAMLAHAPGTATDPSLAKNGFPKITLADKGTFVEACHRFPETVRRCLVWEYAADHQDLCISARRAYDERNTQFADVVPGAAKGR